MSGSDGASGAEDAVLYEATATGVAIVTFNRPERLNAWGPDIAAGLYGLVTGRRKSGHGPAASGMSRGRLLVTGAALSIDNLVIGFALGAYHVSVVVAALVIGLISVGLSLIGLELGARIGSRTGDLAEVVGSVVLMGVGAAIAAGLL